MAVQTIQQADVEQQQKKKQLVNDPNKFNQFAGLSRMFEQGRAAVKNQNLPGAYKSAAQTGVTQAQNTANQQVAQKGQGISSDTGSKLGAYVINQPQALTTSNVAPTFNVKTAEEYIKNPITRDVEHTEIIRNSAPVQGLNLVDPEDVSTPSQKITKTTKDVDLNAIQAKIEELQKEGLSKEDAIAEAVGNDKKAIEEYKQAESERATTFTQELLSKLNKDELAKNLGDLGTKTSTQAESEGINRALAEQGPGLGAGKLAALFGRGYDTARYGALDAQIYNDKLQGLEQGARDRLKAGEIALKGKDTAKQDYSTNVKSAKDATTKKSEGITKEIQSNYNKAGEELTKVEKAKRDAELGRQESIKKAIGDLTGFRDSEKQKQEEQIKKEAKDLEDYNKQKAVEALSPQVTSSMNKLENLFNSRKAVIGNGLNQYKDAHTIPGILDTASGTLANSAQATGQLIQNPGDAVNILKNSVGGYIKQAGDDLMPQRQLTPQEIEKNRQRDMRAKVERSITSDKNIQLTPEERQLREQIIKENSKKPAVKDTGSKR